MSAAAAADRRQAWAISSAESIDFTALYFLRKNPILTTAQKSLMTKTPNLYTFVIRYCNAFTYISQVHTQEIEANCNANAREEFYRQHGRYTYRILSCRPKQPPQYNSKRIT